MKQVVSAMLNYKSILLRRARKGILDANESLFGSKLSHQSGIEIKSVTAKKIFLLN